MVEHITVGIVGAGLSGLSCAYYLKKLGHSPVIFEKAGEPGGRCATDIYDGYLLDRGFQALMTSYSEVKKIARLYELDLKRFPSGVNIYDGKAWYPISNPLKHPLSIFAVRKIPFANFSDFVKMGSIYMKSAFRTVNPFFSSIGQTTEQFLEEQKLSKPFLEKFLRPFFGGIFLDPGLTTNPGIFQWTLHFFVEGVAALPRQGMGAIPRYFAKQLKPSSIRYHQNVRAVEGQNIYLESGEEIHCEKIVVATSASQAHQLLSKLPEVPCRSVTTLYFSIDSDAFKEPPSPLLHLNGSGQGPINHLAFVSVVQPSYAPKRKILVSASVISVEWQANRHLTDAAIDQLSKWFKISSEKWHLLKRYSIADALPDQTEPPAHQGSYSIDRSPDIFICGEYVDHPSLNGACASGRKAADVVHQALQRTTTPS